MTLLAEALAERKDIMTRLSEAPNRLAELNRWDEDEKRADDKTLDDARTSVWRDLERLEQLNVAIHRTNAVLSVSTETGVMTVGEAIVRRDRLNAERMLVDSWADIEDGPGHYRRYRARNKDEVKTNVLIAARDLKREADSLAGQIRRLDLAIQQVNWSQNLID
jgi:Family of unknown function (DUF6847)